MKLYMVRKTLGSGVKEYASAGMTFSTKSSKTWGKVGHFKNAIRHRLYTFKCQGEHKTDGFKGWLLLELRDGGKIDVLEIDIDNVAIVETDIKDWYLTNMVKEK